MTQFSLTTKLDWKTSQLHLRQQSKRYERHNKTMQQKYQNIKSKKKPKTTPESQQQSHSRIPLRSFKNEAGRLNLSALFDEHPTKQSLVEKVFLYFYLTLTSEDKLRSLISAIRQKGQALLRQNQEVRFKDLFPESPDLHELYYQMLKGSAKKNIKPLQNIMIIKPLNQRSPLSFHKADWELMEIALGNSTYLAFKELHTRKENNHETPVSMGEFKTLLEKQGFTTHAIEDLCRELFSKSTATQSISQTESSSHFTYTDSKDAN